MNIGQKQVEFLVVDTTAFIQNAPLHDIAENIITCQEVVDEITNKRQLRRLVALPYDLKIKHVFPENVKIIADFAKKTGDYRSLSATDIKVMALTYQIEKEMNGIAHLRNEPVLQRPELNLEKPPENIDPDITGFYLPGKDFNKNCTNNNNNNADDKIDEPVTINNDEELLKEKFENIIINQDDDDDDVENILVPVETEPVNDDDDDENLINQTEENEEEEEEDDDDDVGWITPSNIQKAKKQVNSQLIEEKKVQVACLTTDFAMQNVLKQINLNVSALDGRMIKELRTFILRCYSCFKTTSVMTKVFCPKCGNDTLKKVAVSLDEAGKMQIHINTRRPLTGRGKKFSLPKIKGGKHSNNPVLVEDQPMPHNKPSRLAKTKNDPMEENYIAGYSPFITRDTYSKSAQLGIRPGSEFKQWMKRNPNECKKKRK